MARKRRYQHRTVIGAVRTNDRIAALVALRNKIAKSIDDCDSMRDLAALSRQLTDVLKQLEESAPAEVEGSPLDELEKRRAARGAAAPIKTRTTR